MKKKSIFGVIGLSILIGLSIISCDLFGENNPFVGVWMTNTGYTLIFTDSTWDLPDFSGGGYYNIGWRGTYTFSGNTASMTYIEVRDDDGNWRTITYAEKSKLSNTATISGNKLTWGISTYTKQ